MALHTNYLDRTFTVTDPDARIRVPDDLISFLRYKSGDQIPAGKSIGDFVLIPRGTVVNVSEIDIQDASSNTKRVFARASSEGGEISYGWTSSRNFSDKFRNVTLGQIDPAHGAGRFAATAAWSEGNYTGQVSLYPIIDSRLDIEYLTSHTLAPYLAMHAAAKDEAVNLYLNSGFRSYPEQKHLHDGFIRNLPGFFPANRPGTSKHQSGIALDIPVAGGAGNPEYDWLAEHATEYGFIRTVRSEGWHWEYRPSEANAAKAKGKHTTW